MDGYFVFQRKLSVCLDPSLVLAHFLSIFLRLLEELVLSDADLQLFDARSFDAAVIDDRILDLLIEFGRLFKRWVIW